MSDQDKQPIIDLRTVSKSFQTGSAVLQALVNINLTVEPGELIVLIGPSGCGKSTLLNLLAGFEPVSDGVMQLDGRPIEGPGPDRGFVFQDYALFGWRTVLGNVSFGLESQGLPRRQARAIAMQYIRLVGLEGFEDAYPHTLSGGMKQRVGIARALAYDPKVLLMDEPFGALDAQTRKYMQAELVRIWGQAQKTIIFVTHSVIEAVYLADRIVVLTSRPGRVKDIIPIDLPRPRDYTGEGFLERRAVVLASLDEELQKDRAQHPGS